MHRPMPPLSALRAFEAAARHMSLTKAAHELHVTAGALSHQIRGLEELLGLKLFERRVRSIALTPAGKQLYPGLQSGFQQIREAVADLARADNERVIVISTPPGFTAKWLAPRLYRFSLADPDLDVRVSSSLENANFRTDGVDASVRHMTADPVDDAELVVEKLIDLAVVPVCSPKLLEEYGPFAEPSALSRAPLIHDDTFVQRVQLPSWADWFAKAGVQGVQVSRGLRFNSADHALDATVEGAGVLLAHDLLAYDDLRTGRLVVAFPLVLPSGRAYHFVYPKRREDDPRVQAFRVWIKQEAAALDFDRFRPSAH